MKANLKELTIELTQRCPNACLFCSSLASVDSDVFLRAEDICSLCVEAKALGLEEVSLSGGEPLCHPSLARIVDGLKRAGLSIALYTTGLRLLSGDVASFLKWSDFAAHRMRVVFNIQSTDEAVHDMLMGNPGALNLTHESLIAALDADLDVEAHMVPNRMNLGTIESSVHELANWGVKKISFLRIVYQGCARANLAGLYLDKEGQGQLRDILKRLSSSASENVELRFGIPFSGDIERPEHCTAGNRKLIVRYDGKVLPCEAFKDADDAAFVLGDIRKDSLRQMLSRGAENTRLNELRNYLCEGETCPAQMLSGVH